MQSTVYDAIRTKRAVREFRDEPLPDEVVERILNAGRLSGSAKNMQPWHFVAVRDRDTLRGLSQSGAFARHLAGAALGVALVTADPFYRLTVPFDLGRATQNMMLAAWEQGVVSVMATMYRPDVAREVLGVPDEYTIPWCISFGYPGEPDQRAVGWKQGRRGRDDVVHYERW